jgi:hypothetical protein
MGNVLHDLKLLLKDRVAETGVFYISQVPSSVLPALLGRHPHLTGAGAHSRPANANGAAAPAAAAGVGVDGKTAGTSTSERPSAKQLAMQYVHSAEWADVPSATWTLQSGVIRINCVDCLDRTNVAMFCAAKCAMRHQLEVLGVTDGLSEDLYPEVNEILQNMFTVHGDRIAHQYAGSGAMHKEALFGDDSDAAAAAAAALKLGGSTPAGGLLTDSAKSTSSSSSSKKPSTSAGIAQNALSAVKRYYSNNVTDVDKQHAINVRRRLLRARCCAFG